LLAFRASHFFVSNILILSFFPVITERPVRPVQRVQHYGSLCAFLQSFQQRFSFQCKVRFDMLLLLSVDAEYETLCLTQLFFNYYVDVSASIIIN